MPRRCGPCGDPLRNELDRRILEIGLNGESYRKISQDFGYSEFALRRHRENHLSQDLADIQDIMITARETALAEAQGRELEEFKAKALEGTAGRLEAAKDYFDQLREIMTRAACLLDRAEAAKDLKAAVGFLKELREQIRLMAELEGKFQPQITIINNPEWIELRTLIINALEPYPQARVAVVHALP